MHRAERKVVGDAGSRGAYGVSVCAPRGLASANVPVDPRQCLY